jgi:hypothetical protein
MATKPPKGQKVPGTETYHVDEPTTGETEAQKRAKAAAAMLPGPLGEAAKAQKKSIDRTEEAERKAMEGKKHGGKIKAYAKGGSIDGCATKGKTHCKVY